MSSDPLKPWSNKLVEFAFAVLVAALMLSWAWALLRPLVPVIVTVAGLLVTGVVPVTVVRWWRARWW